MGQPVCLQERSDCFAFENGRCSCLSNTSFKNKNVPGKVFPCPFSKTKEEFKKGLEKYPFNEKYGMEE